MTASSRTEHGSASRPARISCPAAARRMVAASAVDMETGDGGFVEARATRSAGRIVHASGPHLEAWAGMQLWWRFLDEEEYPHRAEVRVVEAQFASTTRAALVLEVAAVEPDRAARRHARRPVSGSATLTAVECQCIAGTDSIGAALHDISESGVGLVVTDDRVRSGDRFVFRARLPEGAVDTHVRVARVSRRPGGGRLFIGAAILDPAPGAVSPATRCDPP